jgi:hypothetical protein
LRGAGMSYYQIHIKRKNIMHPSSLLSYYPNYAILDEILSKNNYRKMMIYIDLKNNLQSTYMEHAIVNIVENSKLANKKDTSIFSSIISFLSFHKMYGIKRGVDIDFFIFFESGRSSYHLNIDKNYKISRKVDDLYGLNREDKEAFYQILDANYQLTEATLNRIPGIKVFRMPRLEADFIPYYLLSRGKVPLDGSVANVIYSNDHDLMQCLQNHTFIFSKSGKSKKILTHGTVMKDFLKKECKIDDSYLPLAMSIIGDVGDDVTGVNKVGPARFLDMFDELVTYTGTMDQIYDRVRKNQIIFDPLPTKFKNKYLRNVVDEELNNKTVSNNLKLVSFELISRELDDPNSTEMLEKRRLVEKILDTENNVPCDSLKKALNMHNVYLEESSLDFLYL